MKPKDIIGLIIALVFLGGALFLLLGQNKPKASNKSTASQVELVTPISAQLDPNGVLDKLDIVYHVTDYKRPIDLSTGLGNPVPFGR